MDVFPEKRGKRLSPHAPALPCTSSLRGGTMGAGLPALPWQEHRLPRPSPPDQRDTDSERNTSPELSF